MSWKDILKSYELSQTIKDFIYRTEIKPNMYEFLLALYERPLGVAFYVSNTFVSYDKGIIDCI